MDGPDAAAKEARLATVYAPKSRLIFQQIVDAHVGSQLPSDQAIAAKQSRCARQFCPAAARLLGTEALVQEQAEAAGRAIYGNQSLHEAIPRGMQRRFLGTATSVLCYIISPANWRQLQDNTERFGAAAAWRSWFKGLASVAKWSALMDILAATFGKLLSTTKYLADNPSIAALGAIGLAGLVVEALNFFRCHGAEPPAGHMVEDFRTTLAKNCAAGIVFSANTSAMLFIMLGSLAIVLGIWAPTLRCTRLIDVWNGLLGALGLRAPGTPFWAVPDDVEARLQDLCPDMFCPLSRELFVYPVELDGAIYDYHMISSWVTQHGGRHPVNNKPVFLSQLTPCVEMHRLINEVAKEFSFVLETDGSVLPVSIPISG